MDLNLGQVLWIVAVILAGAAIWYFKMRKKGP